jgi:hypothetical protein
MNPFSCNEHYSQITQSSNMKHLKNFHKCAYNDKSKHHVRYNTKPTNGKNKSRHHIRYNILTIF